MTECDWLSSESSVSLGVSSSEASYVLAMSERFSVAGVADDLEPIGTLLALWRLAWYECVILCIDTSAFVVIF